MSPRKYITEHPPHLEQYLLNLENQEGARRLTSPQAQSRITALIGTQHSRQDDLGKDLHELYNKATAPSSEREVPGELGNATDTKPSANPFPVDSDTLWRAFSKALEKHRPDLFSIDTLVSLRKGKTEFLKGLTETVYRSILEDIVTEIGAAPPFHTPTTVQIADKITSSLRNHSNEPAIDTGYQILEDGTHPLLEPKWLVHDILGFADSMTNQNSKDTSSTEIEDTKRLTTEEVIEHFRNNVQDMLIVDRAALDDRRTFWNATVATLYDGKRWHEQLSNFIWRSGQQIIEFLINVYTRIPLFRATDSHNSEMGTVKLLIRNLGRKHGRPHRGTTDRGPNKYILIWINRGSGWHAQSAEESPLFNALVHHLNDEGYLRDVPYGVAFHLVIAGRGDTRYILDDLGIDSSGRHFRSQFLDLGRLPVGSACELLENYRTQHLISYFDDQFHGYFKAYCDLFFNALNPRYANSLSKQQDDDACPQLTADLAEFFFNQQVRYVGSSDKRRNYDGMINKFYKAAKDKSLFAGAHRRHLKVSMARFYRLYITNTLPRSADQPDNLDEHEIFPSKPPFRLFDWRPSKSLCTLARVMHHVADKSAKGIARVACREAIRRHFKRSKALLDQSNFILFPDDNLSHTLNLDNWDFSELLRQQLDPILLQDAEEVLSDLDRSGCTAVARYVAEGFKDRVRHFGSTGNNMILNAFEVRRIVEQALNVSFRAANEALSSDLGDTSSRHGTDDKRPSPGDDNHPGTNQVGSRTVDRTIANLIAAGFLETIHYRPYEKGEQRPVSGASRYVGRSYRIASHAVLEKLC